MAGAYGSECASRLGLLTASPRLRTDVQTGPTLLDNLEGDHLDEPDDHCDGHDR